MANEVTGLHTQQICSVQIGTRDGNNSVCMHVCQNIQVCFVVLLMLLLLQLSCYSTRHSLLVIYAQLDCIVVGCGQFIGTLMRR